MLYDAFISKTIQECGLEGLCSHNFSQSFSHISCTWIREVQGKEPLSSKSTFFPWYQVFLGLQRWLCTQLLPTVPGIIQLGPQLRYKNVQECTVTLQQNPIHTAATTEYERAGHVYIHNCTSVLYIYI